MFLSVLSTASSASGVLKEMDHFVGTWVMATRLSPKIISGTGIPSFSVRASMGAALEMGSLRVEMRKRFWVWDVVAASSEAGEGKGSSRAVMWFMMATGDGGDRWEYSVSCKACMGRRGCGDVYVCKANRCRSIRA